MVRRLLGLLLPLAGSALAVWLSTLIIPGITVSAESTAGTVGTVVLIALIFGLVNTVIKPIAKLVGCGIYIITLGLVALVVNGALLMLTSAIAEWTGIPFNVRDFLPDGILGALFIGVVSWALNRVSDLITKPGEPRRTPPQVPPPPPYRPMPSR